MGSTPHLQLPRDRSSKTVFRGARRWLRLDHAWRKCGDLFNGKDEPDRAPLPRSGEEIDELLKNWEECPSLGKMKLPKSDQEIDELVADQEECPSAGKKKRPRPPVEPLLGVWKARSVFHNLEY